MGRKSKVQYEHKIEAVEDYLSGKKGTATICFEMNITKKSFQQWVSKFNLQGIEGLQEN